MDRYFPKAQFVLRRSLKGTSLYGVSPDSELDSILKKVSWHVILWIPVIFGLHDQLILCLHNFLPGMSPLKITFRYIALNLMFYLLI